jgi:hypothetical protein
VNLHGRAGGPARRVTRDGLNRPSHEYAMMPGTVTVIQDVARLVARAIWHYRYASHGHFNDAI